MPVQQYIGRLALVVQDYDEALAFYIDRLGFALVEDTALPEQNKRWVVIKPANGNVDTPATEIVLAQAQDAQQQAVVGQQGGGRVMFFLYTNDFWRDFERYSAAGVIFHEQPREEGYGTVAVFQDLYGNLWDLLQPK